MERLENPGDELSGKQVPRNTCLQFECWWAHDDYCRGHALSLTVAVVLRHLVTWFDFGGEQQISLHVSEVQG